jgi:glucose-6-phosphate isomerase
MVPATLSGLDVSKFLEGAADMQAKLDEAPASEDLALEYAEYQYYYAEKGKSITVMMPYLYNLRSFAQWFRQLWAESLGKRVNNDGELVHTGTTPVAAIGPTDQHSQLQLYNEGPNDKIITFIITDEVQENIPLPNNYEGLEDFAYFKGHNFADILKRELETTAYSLTKNERPNCTIHLPQLDEYNLAQLFYFFEQVTAYMGYLFEINTYNQPGVELSKNAMYGVLGKEGYEKQKEEFENFNSQ